MLSFAQGGLVGLPQGFQKYQGLRGFTRYEDAPDGGELSVVTGSDAIFEDVLGFLPTSSPSGYALTFNNEGEPDLATGGDVSGQTIQVDLYRFLLRKWTGDTTVAINNHAPVSAFDNGLTLNLTVGTASSPVSMQGTFVDPEGDALVYSVSPSTVDPLPAGVRLNLLTNPPQLEFDAPTIPYIKNVTLRATDTWGNFGEFVLTLNSVLSISVPDVTGQLQAAAETILIAAGFTVIYGDPQTDPSVGTGRVISQTPPAFSVVSSATSIVLVLSLGQPVMGGDAQVEYGTINFVPDKGTTSLSFTGYVSFHKQHPPGDTGVPSATPRKTPFVRSPASIGPQGRTSTYKGRK